MKIEQLSWAGDSAIPPGAHAKAVSSADLWSSNVVEGLKAWIASPDESPACGSADLSEAMSLIDGAFQAVRSTLMTYS